MIKKIFFSLSFVFFAVNTVFCAALPGWVNSGQSPQYPQERFLSVTGKGASEEDAFVNAQRNITNLIYEMLAANGMDKVKINLSPMTLMKPFEKGLSYYDKASATYYVLGVIDKNMLRINMEDDLYAAEQAILYRTAVYETSQFAVIPKIRAINELLELYFRRDCAVTLKEVLAGSIINVRSGEFEREKLEIERKRLFDNIVYFIEAENFNPERLKNFLAKKEKYILTELPSSAPAADKGVATISCKISVSKMPVESEVIRYDWIADLVLSDAFNERTVLYSKTSAGDESASTETGARDKALNCASSAMNEMLKSFFDGIE